MSQIRIDGCDLECAGHLAPPTDAEDKLAKLLGDLFAGCMPLAAGAAHTYRTPADVDAALSATPVEGANATTLGAVTIYRPGLGNTAPGPAFIARLTKYSGNVVVAYANPGDGDARRLRKLADAGGKIDLVDMPPAIAQRVFVIGSPANRMISWETASDVFLEQLDTIRTSAGLNIPDFRNARFTVFAHSQGGLDALTSKKRLIAAGLPNVIGDIYTLNTPFQGSPVAALQLVGLAANLSGLSALDAVRKLDPKYVNGASAHSVNAGDAGHIPFPIMATTEPGSANLRNLMKFLAGLITPLHGANDGLVTKESQGFLGRPAFDLTQSYDHAGIAEDWTVVDKAVEAKLAP